MVLDSGIKTLNNYFKEKEEIQKRDSWNLYQKEMEAKDNLSSDPVVNQVIDKLAQRSDIGISKYGCTLADSRLNEVAWLVHLQDELMDGANYAQVLINKIKEKPEKKELNLEELTEELTKVIYDHSSRNVHIISDREYCRETALKIKDYLIGANII
jgi:hypothetical protein